MPKSIVFDLPGNSLGDPCFYSRGPVPEPDEANPVKLNGEPLVAAEAAPTDAAPTPSFLRGQ